MSFLLYNTSVCNKRCVFCFAKGVADHLITQLFSSVSYIAINPDVSTGNIERLRERCFHFLKIKIATTIFIRI